MKYTHTYTHKHTYTPMNKLIDEHAPNSLLHSMLVFSLLVFGYSSFTAYAQANPVANTASVSVNDVSVLEGLKAQYPDFGIKSVKRTKMENVYEVRIRDQIAYVFVQPQHTSNPYRYFFLGGHLVDLERRINLTTQAREEAQRIDVKTLPLENAITEKRGKGENVLYVFSDVDCGHCRRLHETLSQLTNVTIHTFMVPMAARYDTKRLEKSALVWCDKNRVKAYDWVMRGEVQKPAIAGCETPLLKNLTLADTLYVKGTPTVFFADGSRIVGNQLKREGFEERFAAIQKQKKGQ